MGATAKLRRAQQAIEANRPYANRFNRILTQLVSVLEDESAISHPLLETRSVQKVCVVAVSADRGLCGSFNANIFKHTFKPMFKQYF